MRPAQVAPPTRQGVIGRALRVVVACMTGFVIAAAGTSLIWWALVDEPTPRLASELLDTLAPQAVLEQARVAYPIDTHLGASVIRAEVDRLDLGQLTDRATSAGWSSTRPSDDTVVIDTGDTRLEVTPTSLTVDPHQSPWPALAQLLAGLAGAGAVALTAVVRARTGGETPRQRRRRTAVAAGFGLPIAAALLAIGFTAVVDPVGRLDSGSAVFATILFFWWLLVPIGAGIALLVWFATPAAAGPGPVRSSASAQS